MDRQKRRASRKQLRQSRQLLVTAWRQHAPDLDKAAAAHRQALTDVATKDPTMDPMTLVMLIRIAWAILNWWLENRKINPSTTPYAEEPHRADYEDGPDGEDTGEHSGAAVR